MGIIPRVKSASQCVVAWHFSYARTAFSTSKKTLIGLKFLHSADDSNNSCDSSPVLLQAPHTEVKVNERWRPYRTCLRGVWTMSRMWLRYMVLSYFRRECADIRFFESHIWDNQDFQRLLRETWIPPRRRCLPQGALQALNRILILCR